MSRHASVHNKRDANESDLVALVERMGVHWFEGGPLDGWVNVCGWIPVEIKNPDGRNQLQRGQECFITLCIDRGWPVWTWRTTEDAIECINARRAQRQAA